MIARIAGQQLSENVLFLGARSRGHALDNERKRPDIMLRRVIAADPPRHVALVERRVVLREQETPRVFVVAVVGHRVAKIGSGEQAGDVCIVGKNRMAETVHFVGVDVAVLWNEHQAVGLNAALHFVA